MTLRFLDTNILLYSISRDPTETAKRDRAVALIDAGGNALSVQVLQKFYVQATRPTRRDALPQISRRDSSERGCGSRCKKHRFQS
jgi:predicted nucleic acid-binding protein